MLQLLANILLSLQLAGHATAPGTYSGTLAEATCDDYWEHESDGWHSCVLGLESWRCEVQGWCSGGESVLAIMPLADPMVAGGREWL
jgi:hypothetical protein